MKRVLSVISDIDKVKNITNKVSILDSIKEVQEAEDFDGWYLDKDGTVPFDAANMQQGSKYTLYGLKTTSDIDNTKAIKFTTDGNSGISIVESIGTEYNDSLEYSKNGKDWSILGLDTVPIAKGEKLYVRGKNPDGLYGLKFKTTGDPVYCSGNIMYLLDYENELDEVPRYAFYNLFLDCNIVTAPELPATTLSGDCYYEMFRGCTNLVTAPELPAESLAIRCYVGMFDGCSSLKNAPKLPAKSVVRNCYIEMFTGCTALETAPELPAKTLSGYCYSGMFAGCTALTTAPELPAETMSMYCYQYMFEGCTALETAPELPATTLASSCYQNMFDGCTNLKQITCLYTGNDLFNYTSQWVRTVNENGTFYKDANATWDVSYSDSAIPVGWTVAVKN